jgi:hypothetical protein
VPFSTPSRGIAILILPGGLLRFPQQRLLAR